MVSRLQPALASKRGFAYTGREGFMLAAIKGSYWPQRVNMKTLDILEPLAKLGVDERQSRFEAIFGK